ncbi:MAG: hypothetical protein MJ183_05255 [Treponemataceae bacterium]|nr:hypothetical protein [Treponemataceae bacterium]
MKKTKIFGKMAGLLCSLALVLCLFGCPGEPDMPGYPGLPGGNPDGGSSTLKTLSISSTTSTIEGGANGVVFTASYEDEPGSFISTSDQASWIWTVTPSNAAEITYPDVMPEVNFANYTKARVTLSSTFSGYPGDTITVTCAAGGKTASSTLTVAGNVVTLDLNGGSTDKKSLHGGGAYDGTTFAGDSETETYSVFKAIKQTGKDVYLPTKWDLMEEDFNPGYKFNGWGTTVDATTPVPNYYLTDESVTLYAIWEPSDHTPYSFVINKEKLDGSYENNIPRTEHGTTGTAIDVESLYAGIEGFEFESVTPANPVIAADGSTMVEIKLKRKEFTLTFDANGGTLDGNGTLKVKYETDPSTLTFPSVTNGTKDLEKWDDVPAKMTADTTVKAKWLDIAPSDPDENGIVTFGYWPQTVKKSDVRIIGLVTDGFWSGYYKGSDDAYYAKETAAALPKGYDVAKFADKTTVIKNGDDYYFMVEPIKWKTVADENGTRLVAVDILEAKIGFDSIRTFLSGNFKTKAFGTSGAAKIDGDITLLSKALVTSVFGSDSNAVKHETDYAKARGINWDPNFGVGYWYLSDAVVSEGKVTVVEATGGINAKVAEESKATIEAGIVPTLCITNN